MVENLIVRVIGKDLDGTKSVDVSLRGIKGISHRVGLIVTNKFCAENNTDKKTKIGDLSQEEIKSLEKIIQEIGKTDLPRWALNRRKDYETGEDKHLTMNDLYFQARLDFQRLAEIKSYRGLRRSWGLTVRGQKTRSTHRGKGGSVGVAKKDTKKK
jgi:small subunit ribosomal protein S13